MSEPVNRSLEEMVDSKHENVLEPIRIVGASDQYKCTLKVDKHNKKLRN